MQLQQSLWHSKTLKQDPGHPQYQTSGKIRGKAMEGWGWKSYDSTWMHQIGMLNC